MQLNKIVKTLDSAFPHMGIAAGHQVAFNDGLPTIDDGLAFYISQLANVESKIYEAKYTKVNYEELIPVNTDVPEWADSWDYISYDAVTLGKFIGSSADDLPNVGLSANKSSVPIGYAGNMFDYSLDELRKSQQLRMPVDVLKARATFRGAKEHMQRVAYFGDASRKMTGLFNNPNLALTNSTLDWFSPTTTGDEIVADMNKPLVSVWINSAQTHLPNVLILDSKRFALISERRMGTGSDNAYQTILEYFKRNNLYTSITGRDLAVFPRLQLTAAQLAANGVSNGNKDRMMTYELNEDNLGLVNPIPWRTTAPQMRGLNIEVPCEYKISGTEFRYPFSGAYVDHA